MKIRKYTRYYYKYTKDLHLTNNIPFTFTIKYTIKYYHSEKKMEKKTFSLKLLGT